MPIANVALTVIPVPEIGKVPLTVAVPALTATKTKVATWPAYASWLLSESPAMVRVFVVPALTTNASFKTVWWLEFKVFAVPILIPFSSKRTIPENTESADCPPLSIVTDLTVMSPSAEAVKLILVNGLEAKFSPNKPASGCVPADTVKPVPAVVTTGVIPPVGGVTTVPAVPATAVYLALEAGPKIPIALTPFADCQEATAAFVMLPK